jgi:macrolide-specific efflux system membrane fusion protein
LPQKKPNFKKLLVLFVMLGALAFGGWYLFLRDQPGQTAEAGFRTVAVQKGNLENVVTAQGKLEPRDYVDVGAQVSGQLKKIHVEIGDVVTAGQLLAEIDPEIYESRVKADEARLKTLAAQLAEQTAQLSSARLKLERNQKLIKSKAISQDVFEDAETTFKIAEAKMQSLQAQIEEAQSTLEGDKANLGYTTIYAPMAGTVVLQSAQEGQTLNASQSAPVLVQLANLDTMTVRAQVAEADVMNLKEGLAVYFTTLGDQDRKWNGTIRQILPSPETVNDVVLYNVLVDVDNTDRRLMTGMSTQMFFVLGRAQDALLIPVAALGKRMPDQDNKQGKAYEVRVMRGKDMQESIVHIGLMDRVQAEIISGLALGDMIAVPTATGQAGPAGGAGGAARRGGMPRL